MKGDRSIAKTFMPSVLPCDSTLLFFVLDISENLCYTVTKKEFSICAPMGAHCGM